MGLEFRVYGAARAVRGGAGGGTDGRAGRKRGRKWGRGKGRGGFSLVEVLLATFILGIGMIMVASIFPVGANWTREATEDSVGQVISQAAADGDTVALWAGGEFAAVF